MSSPPPERTVDADALRGLLAHRDPALLSAVLDAAHVAHDGVQEGSEALSERLVAALWWRTHTPGAIWLRPTTWVRWWIGWPTGQGWRWATETPGSGSLR